MSREEECKPAIKTYWTNLLRGCQVNKIKVLIVSIIFAHSPNLISSLVLKIIQIFLLIIGGVSPSHRSLEAPWILMSAAKSNLKAECCGSYLHEVPCEMQGEILLVTGFRDAQLSPTVQLWLQLLGNILLLPKEQSQNLLNNRWPEVFLQNHQVVQDIFMCLAAQPEERSRGKSHELNLPHPQLSQRFEIPSGRKHCLHHLPSST